VSIDIPYPDPPLAEDGVLLRPFTRADADAIVAAVQDPEVPRWTSIPSPYLERDARDYIARAERDRRAGRELGFAIVDRQDETLLGGIGLVFDGHHVKAEVGYWVAAPARRRGVGTCALRLVSRWALAQLGLERVELLVNPANGPSQRLAERAGFTREGVLRSYRLRKGRREDLVMFSLLPGDPDARGRNPHQGSPLGHLNLG
jgi:RimJ/RimL family protein N-acetyltransferase